MNKGNKLIEVRMPESEFMSYLVLTVETWTIY